jgi:hypothetical protein
MDSKNTHNKNMSQTAVDATIGLDVTVWFRKEWISLQGIYF